MNKKIVKARKSYWASVPKEERSARMAIISRKKYANMTIEDRKKIGKRLLLVRKNNSDFDKMK